MAITWYEKFGSRNGTETDGPDSNVTLKYVLFGTSDDQAVQQHVQNNAPPDYNGLVADSYSIDQVGPDLWDVSIDYVDPASRQPAPLRRSNSPVSNQAGIDYLWDFDTSGGTLHITHAFLATNSSGAQGVYVPTGKTAPNFGSAINVGNDYQPQGVDIVAPMMKVTLRKKVARAVIDDDYRKTLEDLTGTVNHAKYRGREKGELLFLGASGTQGTNVDPEVSYHFLAGKNITGLTIGSISKIEKRAHEYLWVWYERVDDSGASALAARPAAVYVHQIYDYGDFTKLSI